MDRRRPRRRISPPLGWEHLPTPDLRGRTIVMTGASDGLGREAALRLALWGADLVLAVRNRAKGEAVRSRIAEETGRPGAVRLIDLDLDDLASVRSAAEAIGRASAATGIDTLVHVAGLVTRSREETTDGFERMLGVNALAPLLLTDLLLPAVRERIVVVSSQAHTFGRVDPADPHFRRGGWSLRGAYGRSKLVTMLWGLALGEELREAGASADLQLVHPGWVLTNLQNATGSDRLDALVTAVSRPVAMPAAEGAAAVLLATTQPLPPGSYLGPDGVGALRGRPTLLRRSPTALDLGLAREVAAWARAEVSGLGG